MPWQITSLTDLRPIRSNDEFKWIKVTCNDDIRADGFGKPSVVERRRVRIALNCFFVHDGVDSIGSDARTDSGRRNIEYFS